MQLDPDAVLRSLPFPILLLSPDLTVITANAPFLEVTGRTLQQLVGRHWLDSFPENPQAEAADSAEPVLVSMQQVVTTLRTQTVPMRRFDMQDPDTGEWVPRYWSATTSPVLDDDGRLIALLHRPQEITTFVREQLLAQGDVDDAERFVSVEQAQADLLSQGRELGKAWAAEATASRRLAALADVALQLARSESIDELIAMITEAGLRALGAAGGAVAVIGKDGQLHSTLTAALGEGTQQVYGRLPLDGSLPASRASATGERVLLPTLEASLAYCEEMSTVVELTRCVAWASIPLRGTSGTVGALTAGWAAAHEFTQGEIELLDALAAQSIHGIERLTARAEERQAAEQVSRMAETLQRSLLTEPAAPARTEIAVRYRPAAQQAQVGGDWYDAFPTADDATFLVVGDVAGHDQNAAAAMGQVRNLLRGVAYAQPGSPSVVLTTLDRAICHLDVDVLATAVLARVHRSAAGPVLQWTNAGHPPPVLVTADGAVSLLEGKADLLLGIDPDTRRHDETRCVPDGALVLLYTDGLVERRGANLEDGLRWLLGMVSELAGHGPDQLCDALLAQVEEHAEDDVALLALRFLP